MLHLVDIVSDHPYHWVAHTSKGSDCVIDNKTIPMDPRNAIKPGLTYANSTLYLCMGFKPLETPDEYLVGDMELIYKPSFNDCLYLDLESEV